MRKEERKEVVINPQIIFQDKHFAVVMKPSGWVVNDAITAKNSPILQNWVKENLDGEISKNIELRNGIVHRLDKETSGVLLVAKTEDAFYELQRLFKERKVQKSYQALVHGKLKEPMGEIDAPVGRLPWNRKRFGVYPDGKEAFTAYKLNSEYEKPARQSSGSERYSLVDLKPKTGRTHQIRVHMKYLGNPVVADEFYAGRKTARADRKWCPRLFLHAKEISFVHPFTDKKVTFESELPEDLKDCLYTLHELHLN